MNKKMKMALWLGLVLAILSSTYLATPSLGYTNGTTYGDEETSSTEDCDAEKLQTRSRDRLQIQNQNGECEGDLSRTRNNHRAEKRNCQKNS